METVMRSSSIVANSPIARGLVTNHHASPQFSLVRASQRKVSTEAAVDGSKVLSVAQDWRNVVFASVASTFASVQKVLAEEVAEKLDQVSDSVAESAQNFPALDQVLDSAAEAAKSFQVPEVDTSLIDAAKSFPVPEVDTSLTDAASSLDPLLLIGGGLVAALPFVLFTVFGKTAQPYGVVSAQDAYAKLGDEESSSQILDIRVPEDVKGQGSPDLKAIKKKVIQLAYSGEPEEYVAKALKKFKDAESTTLYVLDRFDGDSADVAKLLATNGFKAAFAIKDGVEGPTGWQNCDLPWAVPMKFSLPSLDLGGFLPTTNLKDSNIVVPATLAAAAGVGLVVFSEAETALQLLGSAALVQVFIKKFLFAKDRKKTLAELKTFLDTKVAPKELVDELKGIAGSLLPKIEEVEPTLVNGSAALKSSVAEATTGDKAEASGGPSKPPSGTSPQSPYAQYPGMKPPTSPTPTRP